MAPGEFAREVSVGPVKRIALFPDRAGCHAGGTVETPKEYTWSLYPPALRSSDRIAY
jgi:hypothetical protein